MKGGSIKNGEIKYRKKGIDGRGGGGVKILHRDMNRLESNNMFSFLSFPSIIFSLSILSFDNIHSFYPFLRQYSVFLSFSSTVQYSVFLSFPSIIFSLYNPFLQ
jgi:hypothetical protein